MQLTSKCRIQDEDIPSIEGNPIKCLGKCYDDTLQDVNNSKRVEEQVKDGLKNLDRSGLPGKFKAWLFQHGLLPRLTWPLMLYEINLINCGEYQKKNKTTFEEMVWCAAVFLICGFLQQICKAAAASNIHSRGIQSRQGKACDDSERFQRQAWKCAQEESGQLQKQWKKQSLGLGTKILWEPSVSENKVWETMQQRHGKVLVSVKGENWYRMKSGRRRKSPGM